MTAYFIGLFWYRFSDYWQGIISPEVPENKYFVVYFGLRKQTYKVPPDSHFTLSDTDEEILKQQTFARMLFEGEDWDMPRNNIRYLY